MALKLFETSLKHVPAELQSYYAKRTDGCYALIVSDLEAHVAPLKSTIAKMKLDAALKNADVRPQHADLLLRRLNDRLAIDTKDGESIVRILPAASGSLTATDGGPDGATTLDELVAVTAKQFPFLFGKEAVADAKVLESNVDAKVLTRSAFDKLGPRERAAKMSEGYRLTDDITEQKPSPRPAGKVLSRSEFDALKPKERAAKMADGFRLVD